VGDLLVGQYIRAARAAQVVLPERSVHICANATREKCCTARQKIVMNDLMFANH
jgi:hypothetical protein